MNTKHFITELTAVDWHSFGGSIDYRPKTVSTALLALALADQESKEGIYHIEGTEPDLLLNSKIASYVMFAVGNDHSGTYYPAIRKALPFIIQVALAGNNLVARNCAINILIDLYYFCPEDGDKNLMDFVKQTIKDAILSNKENFEKVAVDDARNKSLIGSLISIVEESEEGFHNDCFSEDFEERLKERIEKATRDYKENL